MDIKDFVNYKAAQERAVQAKEAGDEETAKKEKRLADRLHGQLIKDNQKLAYKAAAKWVYRYEHFKADIQAVALNALARTIATYDLMLGGGTKAFGSCVYQNVHNDVHQFLDRMDQRSKKTKARRYYELRERRDQFIADHGREPTPLELGLTPRQYALLNDYEPIAETPLEAGPTPGHVAPETASAIWSTPWQAAQAGKLSELLEVKTDIPKILHAMSQLPADEISAIRLIYSDGRSEFAASQEMGMSLFRFRAIHQSALTRLRHLFAYSTSR